MDHLTPSQRRKCMLGNTSKNTKPEIVVRKYLHKAGISYRLNVKSVPGSPDIVLRKYKTAIFVNGCFWHGHTECGNYKVPSTNTQYWTNKITTNRARDARNIDALTSAGWKVITIWECMLKPDKREATLRALVSELDKTLISMYPPIKVLADTRLADEPQYYLPIAAEDSKPFGE